MAKSLIRQDRTESILWNDRMTQLTGIVCIDGANATGKTTLAEELRKRHGAIILHQTYRFRNNIFNYHTAALRLAIRLAQNRLVVLDRLWMSEVVYASVYRGGTPWPHQGRMVDRVLQKACAVQVVCIERNRELLLERYHQTRSHRTDADAENNARVNDMYQRVVPRQILDARICGPRANYLDDMAELAAIKNRKDVIAHGVWDGSTESTCDLIEKKLLELQSTQLRDALTVDNFLGHVSSDTKFLIVGDKPNFKHKWAWPFHEYANSSLWLTQQLHQIFFDETTALWVNVNEGMGCAIWKLIDEFPKLMSSIKIISLGNLAEKTLREEFDLLSTHIPHPQYGRRFMTDGVEYRERLRTALAFDHPSFLAPDSHNP